MGDRARIATASARLMLLLVALPPLAPAEQECRLSADPAVVTAPVGSSALLLFQITTHDPQGPSQDPGHGACEVARASWFKTRSNERLASYDASTAVWLLSDSVKVRYGARVELSPEFVAGSGGGGSVWLRLLELRMEDAGILNCRIEVSQIHIKATVGSNVRFDVHVCAPRGCEITKATWFRSGRDDSLATYDASTRRWTPSGGSVQYRGRVELSPGNALDSDGGGTAWLQLRELRMEDDGIYQVKVAWRHENKEWTDSENVYLTVLNPCPVNISKSRAVLGGSLSFTLTKFLAGCRLLSLSLQHPGKVDIARAEPVRVLTWDHNSGLRAEPAYTGRVAVVPESKATLESVELKGLTWKDAGNFVITLRWEYQSSFFNVTWPEDVVIVEQAVSKPEVSPRHPVAGGSLSLRCVVHQGSPPISYSWLRGDASSEGNLTATGVHTETWTLHNARHGDAFACEVNNNVDGANTTTERSDVVTVTAAAPGGDGPSTQHYIYWSPVLIILMLIAIASLIIYHRHKGRRQEAAQDDSPPSPPPRPEDEYEALGQRESVYDSLDPSQVQTTNFSSKTRPGRGQGATRVHHPRGGRQASDQYENLPPEHEYEALGHREVLYDSLESTRVQGRGKRGRKEPGHPSRGTSDVSKM